MGYLPPTKSKLVFRPINKVFKCGSLSGWRMGAFNSLRDCIVKRKGNGNIPMELEGKSCTVENHFFLVNLYWKWNFTFMT